MFPERFDPFHDYYAPHRWAKNGRAGQGGGKRKFRSDCLAAPSKDRFFLLDGGVGGREGGRRRGGGLSGRGRKGGREGEEERAYITCWAARGRAAWWRPICDAGNSTPPEISSTFGELLPIYVCARWAMHMQQTRAEPICHARSLGCI